MSMGYMGYVKFGGNLVLATNASIVENSGQIMSGATRGAGWYHAGTHHYSPDTIQYEGDINIELIPAVWNFLKEWTVEERTKSKSVLISPDGINIYQFTGGGTGEIGSLSGLWASSTSFSTSEGGVISCAIGVLGLHRDYNQDESYLENVHGLECGEVPMNYGNTTPYPFWKSLVKVISKGASPFSETTDIIEWNIGCTNNPTVIYACTKSRGPLALVVGEMEASGSVVAFDMNGVNGMYSDNMMDASFEVTIDEVNKLSLPRMIVESDGNDLTGNDSIVTRAFSFKGLAGPSLPSFLMK
jgi:hypothetical protein